MIVRLEVTASEKVAVRSQYEPNNYSVLISLEHLEVNDAEELQAQAETLFRRAKDAIASAKRDDGIEVPASHSVQPASNGQAPAANGNAPQELPKEHQASAKQLDLIQSLAKRSGLDDQKLREFAGNAVGGLTALTKFDASRLINALQHIQVPAQGRVR